MKKQIVNLGIEEVRQSGNALAVRLPERWLVAHGLKVGDPLYSVLTVDGVIRVHLEETDWSKKAKIRKVAARGSAYVTLSAPHARELGIDPGDSVQMEADITHGVLSIWRAPE